MGWLGTCGERTVVSRELAAAPPEERPAEAVATLRTQLLAALTRSSTRG